MLRCFATQSLEARGRALEIGGTPSSFEASLRFAPQDEGYSDNLSHSAQRTDIR